VLLLLVAVALFFWAVNHQQFDDLDSPAILPLLDGPPPEESAPKLPEETAPPTQDIV
jgi:cbb3-type cytochrome oxidase maturation protein